MKVIKKDMSSWYADKKFLLAYPLRPDLYSRFCQNYPHFPPLIINQCSEIVFGHDFFPVLKKNQQAIPIPVLQINLPDKDALILGYNLRAGLIPANLYEKLVLVKKYSQHTAITDIHQKSPLDIKINQELMDHLDTLLSSEFQKYLIMNHICLKGSLRLCAFTPSNRKEILKLFEKFSFTVSQQMQLIEMVEEILFRDKISTQKLFKQVRLNRCLEQVKPQKKIIESLHQYRYPQLSCSEKLWHTEIAKLPLPENARVSHCPFFEKKELQLNIGFADLEALKKFVNKINK